jgi:hypothetical protein
MHVGKQDLGLGVCVCLMGILLAVKLRWDLRTKPWFWGVVVLVLALNMPLIVMVKWPTDGCQQEVCCPSPLLIAWSPWELLAASRSTW